MTISPPKLKVPCLGSHEEQSTTTIWESWFLVWFIFTGLHVKNPSSVLLTLILISWYLTMGKPKYSIIYIDHSNRQSLSFRWNQSNNYLLLDIYSMYRNAWLLLLHLITCMSQHKWWLVKIVYICLLQIIF